MILEHQINHQIATLAGLLKRQTYRIIAEERLEITPDQWVILHYLWEENGLSMGDLVIKSRKDFANVTRTPTNSSAFQKTQLLTPCAKCGDVSLHGSTNRTAKVFTNNTTPFAV